MNKRKYKTNSMNTYYMLAISFCFKLINSFNSHNSMRKTINLILWMRKKALGS